MEHYLIFYKFVNNRPKPVICTLSMCIRLLYTTSCNKLSTFFHPSLDTGKSNCNQDNRSISHNSAQQGIQAEDHERYPAQPIGDDIFEKAKTINIQRVAKLVRGGKSITIFLTIDKSLGCGGTEIVGQEIDRGEMILGLPVIQTKAYIKEVRKGVLALMMLLVHVHVLLTQTTGHHRASFRKNLKSRMDLSSLISMATIVFPHYQTRGPWALTLCFRINLAICQSSTLLPFYPRDRN